MDLDAGSGQDLHNVSYIVAGARGLNDRGEAVYYLYFTDGLRVIMRATVAPNNPVVNNVSILPSAGGIGLSMQGLCPGFPARVLRSDSLVGGSWSNVASFVAVGISTGVVVDTAGDTGFYRVVIEY